MPLKNNNGSVLIYATLIVGVIFAITFALAAVFIPKIKTINEAANSAGAVFAADSAGEWCLFKARGNGNIPELAFDNPDLDYKIDAIAPIQGDISKDCAPLYSPSGSFIFQTTGIYREVGRTFYVALSAPSASPTPTPTPTPSGTPPPLVCDFMLKPLAPIINFPVKFTDQSNEPLSWSWVFQDANPPTSALQNPTVRFTKEGVKTVTLYVVGKTMDCQIDKDIPVGNLKVKETQPQ
ncbi:MAG: hypothetical protein A2750_04110 [Candidatus Yanofskybacteria bacterium RIFCSPHIGHO2_01_FULL_45_42]|uniref:PKD domain-containing protein n=3 Tax=Candidatus Yanofskyibacteriota TaxID=1752733 RepID=A0A1F8EZ14_9BACT|nr:MAG: hypothetical protein A2750_04110 [Candidatus Yanofskybacteria bacterium RIFCSPHIGHO2_01_FULL_45_42]OGN15408.1 MAG: hypothetical protein A3C81_01585 [Candidatus Yanofskybacteria bacterium RIFCSPHIGHO2_02_FULL_46_19]OGN28247.1 MAG: hypothetical protein A3B17_02050 [Candidatus Yanofskybacteria bacterium RIFCSPLOWO2_01_FULL_45_72]OGN32454.1 MAG: hypothetical protein A3J01_00085 [Candidatus Yanofskybacteria bacterium RIFCSPLOWO2_02_FULL_45_18]